MITEKGAPVTKASRIVWLSRLWIVSLSLRAAASERDGTSDTAREEVNAPGRSRTGMIMPCSAPYCAVATDVAMPAMARLCAVIIDSNR